MPFLWISFLFIFLPVFLLIYYTMPLKFRNATIAIGSLLFYLWGDPIFFLILIFLSTITFFFGRTLSHSPSHSARFKLATAAVIICAATSFGFRSGTYILALINQMPGYTLNIFLPMGLAYYSLSCISYILDIYKGNAPCEKNFFSFLVYIALFPKLLAGPVVIYNKFRPQLEPKNIEFSDITAGIRLFIRGIGKKVLLADNLLTLWESISSQSLSSLSFVNAWLGAFSILFVVYFDFSGYADMARGLGRLLGFKLPVNVRFPLVSRSLLEFCSRFQISLFHWLRYYIRLPKKFSISSSLSRFSLLAGVTAIALILWHGWDPSFLAAVLFAYCIILVEQTIPRKAWFKIPRPARTAINFFFLLLIVSIISQNNLSSSIKYLQAMFGFSALFVDSSTLYYLSAYSILLVICFFTANQFFSNRILRFRSAFPKLYSILLPIGQAGILFSSVAYLINSSSHSFLCILS